MLANTETMADQGTKNKRLLNDQPETGTYIIPSKTQTALKRSLDIK